MATFSGSYEYVEETFEGTGANDIFLLGKGDENAVGSLGSDIAILVDSIVDVSSAIYYPEIGKASIVDSKGTIKFLSDIETISFADESIDLAGLSASYGVTANNGLNTATNSAQVLAGWYEYVEETFDASNYSTSVIFPGSGPGYVTGNQEGYDSTFVKANDISIADYRFTAQVPKGTVSGVFVDEVVGIANAYRLRQNGLWEELTSIDLQNIPNIVPIPPSEPIPSKNIQGTNYDDVLIGSALNNKIKGNAGDDIIDGGLGNDRIKGGSGADLFVFSAGKDMVFDFNSNEGDQLGIHGNIDYLLRQRRAHVMVLSGKDRMIIRNSTVELVQSMIVEVM